MIKDIRNFLLTNALVVKDPTRTIIVPPPVPKTYSGYIPTRPATVTKSTFIYPPFFFQI
jgi:hypothetical protein